MLTKRQIQILKELAEYSPEMLTASRLANQLEISQRTVQTEFKHLKEYFENSADLEIVSVVSKGTSIIVHNQDFFSNLIHGEEHEEQPQAERLHNLCLALLQSKSGLTRFEIMERFFISSSTLQYDLTAVERLLAKRELRLDRKPNKAIHVIGSEKNKRLLLLQIGNLLSKSEFGIHQDTYLKKEIEKILVTTFIKYQFRISEILFQNLIIHVYMAVIRIQKGFFITEGLTAGIEELEYEHQAAEEIFRYLARRFQFHLHEGEVLNLAVYIRGKSDVVQEDYITEEMENFLSDILGSIDAAFDLETTQDFDLKLSIALHLLPLITRVRYNIQNKNQMLSYIKENFSLAFDIAAYMGLKLQEKLENRISEDEIAYLAIYFNQFLEQKHQSSDRQNILILTSLKRSLSILLRQRLSTWFPDKLDLVTIVHKHEMSAISIDDYDVIFTTESDAVEQYGAIPISSFPGENEYSKIKLAIDGFKDKSEVLKLFSENRFYIGQFSTKEEVLDKLCQLSEAKLHNSDYFRSAVQQREDLGSSYFKNHIALPHPINPIGVATFLSVILLEKPLVWDEDGNTVQLIILVSIEKNNAKAFQLWNYLTAIIQDKHLIQRLLEKRTFEQFIENLNLLLEGYI